MPKPDTDLMPFKHLLAGLTLAPWLLLTTAQAAETGNPPTTTAPTSGNSEQVVLPKVDRRDIRLPVFPSNDFELGVYGGAYSVQNFGTSLGGGLRLGYHITEDFFVEASLGRSRVSDEAFRRILPGGIFNQEHETLQYANLSAGVNVLPGEVFFGRDNAKPSQLFVLAGVGSTRFNQQRSQTFNLGVGVKVFVRDWFAVRVDMRDHLFSLDLLGKRDRTQNLELNTGLSFLF
jgi:outer membrane beta-barrel protein